MFGTVRLTRALQPRINALKMVIYVVIRARRKLITIKILNYATLQPCADGLLAGGAARKYFYMHNIMLLRRKLRIKVLSTIKYQISGAHLVKCQINRQCIILVGLIPASQFKPEFKLQILNHLPN